MTAHTLYTHSERYGLSGPIVSAGTASPLWVWSDGDPNVKTIINLPPDVTLYNTMNALSSLVIVMAQTAPTLFSVHRVSAMDVGGAPNSWEGDGTWDGDTYYLAYLGSAHSHGITQGIWYYAPLYDLGSVKNISIDTDSPHDVMGMPGQTETGTLAFDVEGVVTTINVDGFFYETIPQTMSNKIGAIRALMNGNQYINPPCVFWWDREVVGSVAKPYFVSVKKFTVQGSEKDVSKVDYKLQLVVRALTV